ncbi:hypothetical protein AB837_00571 [bacterium AB1]|nr:hypothetical protein AB837_00571 [bacterium AB1]
MGIFKVEIEKYYLQDQEYYNRRALLKTSSLKKTNGLDYSNKQLKENFEKLEKIVNGFSIIDESFQTLELDLKYLELFNNFDVDSKKKANNQIELYAKQYIANITKYKHEVIMCIENIKIDIDRSVSTQAKQYQFIELIQKFFEFEKLCKLSLNASQQSFNLNCCAYIFAQKNLFFK